MRVMSEGDGGKVGGLKLKSKGKSKDGKARASRSVPFFFLARRFADLEQV